MSKLKKGDFVVVISGKDKGKRGSILSIIPSKDRVLVSGVNVCTRHVKPNRLNVKGGIDKSERPIHISNVALIDPKVDLPTRIGYRILDDGSKVRYSKRTGELVDVS